jgi:P2-related tail formation protein
MDPIRESLDNGWAQVKDLDAPVLDTMIRQAGWHFMWIEGACARIGIGISRQNATRHALDRALDGIARRFNAAELESVEVSRYPGFHIATVILQPRQIQQQTSLDCPNDI